MEYLQISGSHSIGKLESFYYNFSGGRDAMSEDTYDELIRMLNEEIDETLWAWAAFDGDDIVAACILRTLFIGQSPAYPDGYMSYIIPIFPNGFDQTLIDIAIRKAKEQGIPCLYVMEDERDRDQFVQNGFRSRNSFLSMTI